MIFHHANDAFRQWLTCNSEGYYINQSGSRANHTLHKSECPHLPTADADKSGELAITNSAKQVFENLQQLQEFLGTASVHPKRCRTCNSM